MSGTQSPPLEFTGEEKILGASATNKPVGAANVKTDTEQRGGELNFSPDVLAPNTRGDDGVVIRNLGYRSNCVCLCSLLWWQDRNDKAEQRWE
jgi:hypothetical protein